MNYYNLIVNSFRRIHQKKKEREKKNTRVEYMNILIDLFRRIHQQKKREILLVSIDRFFFFSYSSILRTWLICMILITDIFLLISYDDLSCWTDFISTRILIRYARNDDVKVFIQLLSTIESIIIFDEHWTQTHWRVCHYEVDSIIFFIETKLSSSENDDFTHEKYEIKKKSKKFARHLLMILRKKKRILRWFII